MTQLSLFQPSSWTVTDLTQYLRQLLESDYNLQDLWVQGEVSNINHPNSGHLYFTLKDGGAALKCVMWRNAVSRAGFIPREGEAIEAHGSISVYETNGQYQLYADLIRPVGDGALYLAFLRLKARLEAEGLFDEARKRSIPAWPQRIGVVTSPTGAALRDVLDTLRRRYPLAEVVLAPTQVQGEEAPPKIVAALDCLNQRAVPEVILLVRGGGSIEDLWAFNHEAVARAIVASRAPVITGVGHETDFTIADFVADLRAPTPTAAAELATPNQADVRAMLQDQGRRMQRSMLSSISEFHWKVDGLQRRLGLHSPLARIRSGRQRLDDYARRADLSLAHRLQLQRTNLQALEQRLAALNPHAVLGRGYAIVLRSDGEIVQSAGQVQAGEHLNVRVRDGQFGVIVKENQAE